MPLFPASRRQLLATAALLLAATAARAADDADAAAASKQVSEVVVTASRVDLLGSAATASQGSVTQTELSLRPVYRVGQLLESTPGLVVTAHSGEGKANQYLVRGFNLDHGTDIANFVDDMPINRPTNTHGQGYSDVNFEIPELAQGLDYTKGPYYAAAGDFGAVATTHLKLADDVPNQVSVAAGSFGIYNLFAGGTAHFGEDDRLVGGVYLGHVDGGRSTTRTTSARSPASCATATATPPTARASPSCTTRATGISRPTSRCAPSSRA
jgi:outer membrane receptor protein involved in Fe transport